jgi:hypothetical protein
MADLTLSASKGMTPTAQLYLNATSVGSAISMAEIGTTGEFYADIPSGTAAGEYLVVFFNGATKLTSGGLSWDGTQEVAPLNSAQTQAAAAAALVAYDAVVPADLAGLATAAQVTALGTPLQADAYTAPANTDIAAIKAKTDTLTNAPSASTVAGAVRTELATELGRIDVAVSTRSTLTAQDIPQGLTAAEVWAATTRTLTEAPGLTNTQAEQLRKMAQLHGVGATLVVTETTRTAGDVSQTITTTEEQTTVSAA